MSSYHNNSNLGHLTERQARQFQTNLDKNLVKTKLNSNLNYKHFKYLLHNIGKIFNLNVYLLNYSELQFLIGFHFPDNLKNPSRLKSFKRFSVRTSKSVFREISKLTRTSRLNNNKECIKSIIN